MSTAIEHISSELCDFYHLFRQPRRCYLLLLMARENPPHDVQQIAKQIAAQLNDTSTTAVPAEQYKNVRVSLKQTHFPALQEQDVIRVEANDRYVAPGRNFRLAVLLIRISTAVWFLDPTRPQSPDEDHSVIGD